MPRVEFTKIEEGGSFPTIPEGTYKCEVYEVKTGQTTKNGDEMWTVVWQIIEGQYEGRRIFDNMVFGGGALGKVKLMCSRLGLDVTQDLELEPAMLYKRRCLVATFHEEYQGKKRNKVPYDGYEAIEEKADADIPF